MKQLKINLMCLESKLRHKTRTEKRLKHIKTNGGARQAGDRQQHFQHG